MKHREAFCLLTYEDEETGEQEGRLDPVRVRT